MLKKRGLSTKRKRLDGGGQKAANEEMEDALLGWIMDLRSQNLRVSRRMIRLQARSLVEGASTSAMVSFKASNGWLRRFMKQKGLSLCRKTTVCQTTPADSIPKLVSFIIHLRRLQRRHQYVCDG